nr:hypothetical protein [Tanacetum cinerariifolium]
MSTITLTAEDGEVITRPVFRGWADVPLARYTHLVTEWDKGLPARIEAFAALLDIPAQPLLADVKTYVQLLRLMPWLAQLPPLSQPVAE